MHMHKGTIAACNLENFRGKNTPPKSQYWLKCTLHRKELQCFVGFFFPKSLGDWQWLAMQQISRASFSLQHTHLSCLLTRGEQKNTLSVLPPWLHTRPVYLWPLGRLHDFDLIEDCSKILCYKKVESSFLAHHVIGKCKKAKKQNKKNSHCSYFKSNHSACSKIAYSVCCSQIETPLSCFYIFIKTKC